MKKLIFITACLCLLSVASMAQKNEKYEKRIIVPESDFVNLRFALEQFQRLVIYDPASTPEQKVETLKTLEQYKLHLFERLKLDSVLIKTDSVEVTKPKGKK